MYYHNVNAGNQLYPSKYYTSEDKLNKSSASNRKNILCKNVKQKVNIDGNYKQKFFLKKI